MNKKTKEDLDNRVQNMINNWDKVKCFYCGKTISMLNAKLIVDEYGEEHFVCREEAKYYER